MTVRSWLVVTVALMLGIPLAAARQTVVGSVSVADLIAHYDHGEYTAVDSGLKTVRQLRAFRLELERATSNRSVTSGLEARRLRVVAGLSLEAANLLGWRQWPEAATLVEWACQQVQRAGAPVKFDRTWFWASIALFEAGGAQSKLLEDHVAHALKSFPGDPQFVLARGVAMELATFPDPRDGRPTPKWKTTRIEAAMAALETARKQPNVQHDADVRLGYSNVRLGRFDRALEQLRDIPDNANDPYLSYLSHLFKARAFDGLKRPGDAAAEYRAALELVPGAQTAAFGWVAATVFAGDRAEATRLTTAALTDPPNIRDPWVAYGQPDMRFWPTLIERLHQELR
jgi:tetratricopeptide (TPR) repeat protein